MGGLTEGGLPSPQSVPQRQRMRDAPGPGGEGALVEGLKGGDQSGLAAMREEKGALNACEQSEKKSKKRKGHIGIFSNISFV